MKKVSPCTSFKNFPHKKKKEIFSTACPKKKKTKFAVTILVKFGIQKRKNAQKSPYSAIFGHFLLLCNLLTIKYDTSKLLMGYFVLLKIT